MTHDPDLTAGPNPGLGTWPARRARISPDRTALLDPHRSLTYAELADRTARYAGALRRLGVGPGDRVAYLGVNAVEVFETFFAAWLLGAIAVPLNYRLSGPEIRYMLDDSGASVLVHSADTDALVAAAAGRCRTGCGTCWRCTRRAARPAGWTTRRRSRPGRRSTRSRRWRSTTPP